MKKLFRKITAALLVSAVTLSAGALGTSAAAGETVEVVPHMGYPNTVYTMDDYLIALKRTAPSSEDLKAALDAAQNYVSAVDNSKSKYFPKIGNQGGVGSCVAWSCVYYQFTNAVNKALDREATDDATFQPMFIYNMYNGCNKPRFLENLLYSTGCAPVSMVSDTQNDKTWSPGYDIWREAANYRIVDYIDFAPMGVRGREISSIDDPDIAAVKAVLRNGDILSYAGPIFDHQWGKIVAAPGVDEEIVGEDIVVKSVGSGICNHMLTIVGYNDNIWVDQNGNGKVDSGELGALKIANSWGDLSHNDGFFWIAYDALNVTSSVEGVVSEPNRCISINGSGKFVVAKDYGSSGMFLKYTLNSDNRTDSYIEITAKHNTTGTTYVRKVNPYQFSDYNVQSQKLNYNGETGFCDGAMMADLNNIIRDISPDNFNDYTWNVRFVDIGRDTAQTTVKEAMIVDENTGKTYELDAQFPFDLNKSEKTVSLKNYYHFSKLYVPAASALTVGSALKFTFRTANETFGTTPVKYTMTVSKDGKQVFSKVHKASSIDKANGSSVVKGTWTPTQTGTYTVTIASTDAAGHTAKRSASFRVYNKLLAVRAVNIDKGKYVNTYDTIKITPSITGGTAPYTYSYYYVKGGKTYKIAENIKSSTKSKTFGSNSGTYKILVKVKDAEGKTAQATQTVVVTPPRVAKMIYNRDTAMVGNSVYVHADVNYLPDCVKKNEFIYTVEKDGKTQTLNYTDPYYPEQAVWKPTEKGTYNVTVTVKYKDKVIATKTDQYNVLSEHASQRMITVNAISYIFNQNGGANYKVHYWGGKSGIGDANCISLNKTITKNIGFWNTAQTFHQFVAYIPEDATGYKFHIGDRWFPDGINTGDGSVATSNTAYIFNYDYDRCVYTME